jgi:acyl-CoA synthetase (AMP-forming)/AMP-acid ligase II
VNADASLGPSTGVTLWSLVEARATASPDALLAVDESGRTLTFAEYRAEAESAAGGLAALGVDATSRVSWQLPTRLEAFVLVGALCRLGALQNPMLPIYRERELRFVLGEVRPELVVVAGEWRGFDHRRAADAVVADLHDSVGLDCRVLTCDRTLPQGDPATLPTPPADAGALRWVFYSSGTTAEPKGALHSDATIVAGSRAVAERYELEESDRYPMVFPFTHIGGVGMLVVQLLTGCGAIAIEQYDAELTPPLLRQHEVTIPAGGTPLALLYLQYQRAHPEQRAFPRARAVMTGAAPKPPGLHAELQEEIGGVGAVSVYGLTEAPFLVVSSVRDPGAKLATTEGRAVPGVELRVVADDGRVCGPDEVGEIRARGVVVCSGYLNPDRDAEAFDGDGFFRTGDLGRIDADGFVTVSGRLKDIIIRKGENISAKEVEDVLYAHPDVAEVAVVGLADPVLGERCCAVVLPVAGHDAPTLEGLTAWCEAAGLARQKWPEQLEIVTDFPRNASGKVLKFRLRDLYSERV